MSFFKEFLYYLTIFIAFIILLGIFWVVLFSIRNLITPVEFEEIMFSSPVELLITFFAAIPGFLILYFKIEKLRFNTYDCKYKKNLLHFIGIIVGGLVGGFFGFWLSALIIVNLYCLNPNNCGAWDFGAVIFSFIGGGISGLLIGAVSMQIISRRFFKSYPGKDAELMDKKNDIDIIVKNY